MHHEPSTSGARHSRARRPRGGERSTNGALPQLLGWLSLGLGAAAMGTPRALSRIIGFGDRHTLVRMVGLRELASGLGILSGRQGAGVVSRVVGDVMDLALLGSAFRGNSGSARSRTATAAAVVAGITALDLLATRNAAKAAGASDATVNGVHTVNRPADQVYRFWRDLENMPRFMHRIRSVQPTGERTSHWVANAPAGITLEWDSEITEDRPGHCIAWQSTRDAAVDHAGRVTFTPAPGNRGTQVRVEMHYRPPGGTVGAAVAKVFGVAAEQQLREDLRRAAQLMETGEIATNAGPSARTRRRAA